MEVANNYQDTLIYQRQNITKDSPFVKPLTPKPEHPIYPEKPSIPEHPVFPQEPELTPEERLNIQHAIEDAIKRQKEEKAQKEKEARELVAQYTKGQSIKTQVEIYLSVATDSDVDFGKDTKDAIDILRDIQKQNNIAQGYATYKELDEKKGEFFTT